MTCFDYTDYHRGRGRRAESVLAQVVVQRGRAVRSPGSAYDVSLTPRVNYAYVGPRWTNLFYDPQLDYLEGSRAAVGPADAAATGDWEIEGFRDQPGRTRNMSAANPATASLRLAPREIGVRASVRF